LLLQNLISFLKLKFANIILNSKKSTSNMLLIAVITGEVKIALKMKLILK